MSIAHLYRTLRMCALQRRRESGVVTRFGLLQPGSAARVLSNWGHHEKYHKKQALGGGFAGGRRVGSRRRGGLPERSDRHHAGGGGRRSPGRAASLGFGRRAPADRAME